MLYVATRLETDGKEISTQVRTSTIWYIPLISTLNNKFSVRSLYSTQEFELNIVKRNLLKELLEELQY